LPNAAVLHLPVESGIRNIEKVNYWIYQGTLNEYDVTNRTIAPVMLEDGMAIGNIVGGKK
jgi:hypothetical protein